MEVHIGRNPSQQQLGTYTNIHLTSSAGVGSVVLSAEVVVHVDLDSPACAAVHQSRGVHAIFNDAAPRLRCPTLQRAGTLLAQPHGANIWGWCLINKKSMAV
eukprot:21018-Eustigmatos_ZCMA.PRE.1